MVGFAPAPGMAAVICCVAAIVLPLWIADRAGGGGAGGTRGGGGELGGRCGSVICYFSTKPRAVRAIDGLC